MDGDARRPGRSGTVAARSVACLVAVVLAAIVLVATGCGLRPDDQPQAISPSSLPPGLVAPGSTVLTGANTTIFLVTNDSDSPRLAAKEVGVSTDPGVSASRTEEAIATLFRTMPEKSENLVSPVSGTPLLWVRPEGGTLVVNLGTLPVEGTAQTQAFAQIVYTADAQGEYDRFRFLVNDKSVSVPLGDRTAESGTVVSIADFAKFRPDAADATPATSANTSTGDS